MFAMCGQLQVIGNNESIWAGGCRTEVRSRGHAVWYEGETEAIIYHEHCCPQEAQNEQVA